MGQRVFPEISLSVTVGALSSPCAAKREQSHKGHLSMPYGLGKQPPSILIGVKKTQNSTCSKSVGIELNSLREASDLLALSFFLLLVNICSRGAQDFLHCWRAFWGNRSVELEQLSSSTLVP